MPTHLTEHLLSRGLISAQQAAQALTAQRGSSNGLDTHLLEQGAIGESALLRAVSEVSGQRAIDLADFEVNPDVAPLIPPKIADRFRLVPLSVQGDALHVACCYPIPDRQLREISFLLNKRLELWIGLEVRIRDWMRSIYDAPLSEQFASLLARLDSGRTQQAAKKKTTAFAEEVTLEQSLTRDLIDRLAQSIVDEPISAHEGNGDPTQASASAQVDLDAALATEPDELDDLPSSPIAFRPRTSLSKLPGPALGAVPARRYGEWDPQAIPDWTLSQARVVLKNAAKDRDQIIDVTLQYARRAFEFTALFAVIRGAATIWQVRGEGSHAQAAAPPALPIDAPSVFRTVCTTRRGYVGPVPPDPLTRNFLGQLGRSPRTIFLFPVEVSGRLVAIVYGDCSHRPMSRRRLSDFVLFCQDLPRAFQELIVLRRHRRDGMANGHDKNVGEEQAVPESITRVVWSPAESTGEITPVKMSPRPLVAPQRQLPDWGMLLRRLTGADPEKRASALAELGRFPEASAEKLVLHFPGPTAWSRLAVVELPEAEELGPIPAALSSLGQPAARALAPVLDSNNPYIRYFALLTAGSLPYAEVVDGILRGLFAVEPEIASAARSAATAFRRNAIFERAIKHLRQELASINSLRRSLAARALGALDDRESIDVLIGLTGSEDQSCATAAAEALREITKASFGPTMREWKMWWAENRDRSRAEWLVAALRSEDAQLRFSAIQELSKAFNDALGYFADAPAHQREAAVRRWEALIADSPPNRRDV
jgi:HEAT repeat protein